MTQHSRSVSFLLLTGTEAPQDARYSRQESIEVRPLVPKGILSIRQIGIEISYIPRNLIIVIFYYQISLNPLKTLRLSQVNFPFLFPLCYIVPPVFTNSDKSKYKGTRCPVDICSVPTEAAAETKKISSRYGDYSPYPYAKPYVRY